MKNFLGALTGVLFLISTVAHGDGCPDHELTESFAASAGAIGSSQGQAEQRSLNAVNYALDVGGQEAERRVNSRPGWYYCQPQSYCRVVSDETTEEKNSHVGISGEIALGDSIIRDAGVFEMWLNACIDYFEFLDEPGSCTHPNEFSNGWSNAVGIITFTRKIVCGVRPTIHPPFEDKADVGTRID